MLIVFSWLCEHIDMPHGISISPQETADMLTHAGLEVEGLIDVWQHIHGVTSAKIVDKKPHPNSDHLTIIHVIDNETNEPVEVVCGAPNVPDIGGQVVWAKPGATLASDFTLGSKKLRGVMSAGMLCSEKELGLSNEHEGIIVLEGDYAKHPLGTEISTIYNHVDVVFDIGIPANRPDLLGHKGIAREVIALIGGKLKQRHLANDGNKNKDSNIDLSVTDHNQCHHYVAREITKVTVAPSPLWMKHRLHAVGVRSISNVIDITNYVMFDLGHPLHAFDKDCIENNQIIVRQAKDGETVTTLDSVERSLTTNDIVVADTTNVLALAGVMGGKHSQVTEQTNHIILEAATFEPTSVRKTSKRFKLSSESSHRFERGVDTNGINEASLYAAQLIKELAGGQINPSYHEQQGTLKPPVKIILSPLKASFVIGVEFSQKQIIEGLKFSSIDVHCDEENVLAICPTFRADLTREIDVIEEIARLYGFYNIPTRLYGLHNIPSSPKFTTTPHQNNLATYNIANRAREILMQQGLSEMISLGFTSTQRVTDVSWNQHNGSSYNKTVEWLKLENPLVVDHEIMRPTLIPNMLSALVYNQNHGNDTVTVFEIGNVFSVESDHKQRLHVAVLFSGYHEEWTKNEKREGIERIAYNFWDIEAVAKVFCDSIGLIDYKFTPCETDQNTHAGRADIDHTCLSVLHPNISKNIISANNESLGFIGEITPMVMNAYDIDKPCVVMELSLDTINTDSTHSNRSSSNDDKTKTTQRQMQPIAKFPSIVRDLSFFIENDTSPERIQKVLEACNQPLLVAYKLMEIYRDIEHVPKGKEGMLWSLTYRSDNKTLTDTEIDAIHEKIIDEVIFTLKVTRR